MLSAKALSRGINRVRGMAYFPKDNETILEDVADVLRDLFTSDEQVERALKALTRNPDCRWISVGDLMERLKTAIYEHGMVEHNGRWVPDPRNGPEYDFPTEDGRPHWWGNAYLQEGWTEKQMQMEHPGEGRYSSSGSNPYLKYFPPE